MEDRFKTPDEWRCEHSEEVAKLRDNADYWQQRYEALLSVKREDAKPIDARLLKIYLNTRHANPISKVSLLLCFVNLCMTLSVILMIYAAP